MKTNKIFALLLAAVFATAAAGCRTDEIKDYKMSDSAVYFDKPAYGFSFYDNPWEMTKTVEVPVGIIGAVSPYEREIRARAASDGTTAPAASYKINGGKVPANAQEGVLYVDIRNTAELQGGGIYMLNLELEESRDFRPGYPEKLITLITWDDWMPAPGFWDHRQTAWGTSPGEYISYIDGPDDQRIRGVFSTALGEFILGTWEDGFDYNIDGWMGKDREIIEQYPLIPISGPAGIRMIKQLVAALEALGSPLLHSDDAFAIDRDGVRTAYPGNPPVKLNPSNLN